MVLQKIKLITVGVAITGACVFIYNKHDSLKTLRNNSVTYSNAQINPEFANYISAFTTGFISSNSTIKIKLANELNATTELNVPIKEELISFSPNIEGTLVWKDGQNLEFKPTNRLPQGEKYKATFHLSKLTDVKSELKDFEFEFQTVNQSIQAVYSDLKCYNSNDFDYYFMSGSVNSADFVENELIEKTLLANYEGKNLNIKWNHNEKGTTHQFLIDSIERPNSGENNLQLLCNGKSLNLDYTKNKDLVVPQNSNFKLLSTSIENDNDQFVALNFSNPIDPNQSLEGLINIGGINEVKYIVANNQVFIYPNETNPGSYVLTVNTGVRDSKSGVISKKIEQNIVFSQVKPAMRFVGDGNILPSTNGITIPFETVNLKAVDVKIIRIYENNVLQFLQNNDMNGGSQLAQVGKKILEKRVNLGITNPSDFSVWKKTALDISTLIKPEPGAIYRVTLSIKKDYSTYPCVGNSNDSKFEMQEIKPTDEDTDEESFGYYYDDYSYDYYGEGDYDGSSWEDRDNPCKNYYYTQYNRKVSKNIIASDLGLTLKKGNDGTLFAVINDLITTKPLGDVTVELYDFQKQLLETVKTNAEGQVYVTPKRKASFLVAKKDKQRAYLRLDDGASLALSMYDVSGDEVKKGLKGFIYGERGVWRPGDSLFLNFILEDKTATLPANHPVIFSLTNPQGQVYKRLINNKSTDGFYNFSCATDKNAPTGLWSAEVKVGPVRFNKSIRIETIMPNRLKIEVNVGDNKLIVGNQPQKINLHTNWLTGAVAKNLAANISVALSSSQTYFEKFGDYNFQDATLRFESQNLNVFDGKVDEQGNASVPLNISATNASGFLKANFTTRVFEQGGAFSVDRFSIDYSPFTKYVGIKLPQGESGSGILYTGKTHKIDIATVDYTGKPTSVSNLKFELYKLDWRWWWDQYNDEIANYASDNYHKPILIKEINSVNGKASVDVTIKENEWGRYLIRVVDIEGGHSCSQITYFDWSNWMERDGGTENKIVSNMLHFTSDKTKYKTGEEVKIKIPTPQGGRALVTIENGSHVMEAHWVETEKGNTTFAFKVKPEMAPNVYLHVSLMQPHSRTNDLPIRLYGVLPITIDDPETHLRPKITMPEVLMPEKNVSIKVSEENGKEMAFTIAVVDEGLLDITRFKTPNPHSTFYAKEALGVKTWDCFDNVIGAFGADLERVLSIGGDGSEMDEDGAKANRFKPMVKFFGPFHLGKGDNKTINFTMPMYVGSVRTMVIAGKKGAYGLAEKTTPVKAPLMILGTLPRVLSVTEEVKLPVSVFGGDKAVGKTDVKVEVNGLLQTIGQTVKSVNVGKDDEKNVYFDLKVKNSTGIAKVKVTATGGGHTTTYEYELDVRNPNPYQTSIKDCYVEGGQSLKQPFAATGLSGTNKGVLEISTIPPINLEERLHYLINYPHGCVEQTTSQVFAQLFLADIMDLSPAQKTEIDKNIKGGINELRKFQTAVGGLSYWQGSADVNDWGTTYAGHFLILAEKNGYTLPSNFKKEWLNFMQTTANSYDVNKNTMYRTEDLQAYRLYVLALSGNTSLGAMNRLREYPTLSNNSRWLLAAAYAQAGQISEAEKIIAKANTLVTPYSYDYYTYGSSDRDEALILNTLCMLGKKQQAFAQIKKVSAFLGSNKWLSTQTTAYGLLAVSNFIKKYGDPSAMQANVTINGKEHSLKGKASIMQFDLDLKNNPKGNFEVKNNGKGVLYARIITRGKPAIGSEEAANSNISIDVTYKDKNGNALSVEELAQGSDFKMSVTVKNLGLVGEIKNLALMNYVPAGWEIHNARMDENEEAMKNSSYTYQDTKDDKVLTYFDLGSTQSKTFNFSLNASYEGKYYLPAINVEAMYDDSIYARNKGYWIKVSKEKNDGVAGK